MSTLLYAAAFAFGAWWLQQQAVLPGLSAALPVLPLILLAWMAGRRNAPWALYVSRALWFVGFALSGFLWAAATANWTLSSSLPEIWEGRDIRVSGTVAEMPQPGARALRFTFEIEQVLTPGAEVPPRIALVWFSERGETAKPVVRAGQRWQFSVRLRRPHANANPFGFDLEPWLLERRVRAVGYVRSQDAPTLMSNEVWRMGYLREAARERVRERLMSALADRPYAGVIVALAVGDQRAIPREQWKVFTRAGVNHLMSISGLHITMVAALVFALVLRLWRLAAPLAVRIPALRAATAAGLVAALAYAALAGFAVPAQRTVYMLAAVALALWSGWRWPSSAILGLALFAVVIADPMAVLSAGFWLSFGAVCAITLAGAGGQPRRHWLGAWLRMQWAVTIALVPLLLALFQQVSLVSPLANAIAIPVVSLCVAPLALLSIVLPLDFIAIAAHGVMSVCMGLLEALVAWPSVTWQQHAPLWWAVPLGVLGAGWLLMPRGFPSRWAGLVLMLPLFLARPIQPEAGALWITVLDVGQGLAVLVRTRNHSLLFDTGPQYSESGDAGERIVVPNLRGSGIDGLDLVVVSHDDSDHAGGVASVLAALPVQSVLTSSDRIAADAGKVAGRCVPGQRWRWDGIDFEMLHPAADSYNHPAIRDNDRSCVLRIVSAYGSVLIPGDIERRSEQELVAEYGEGLAADVLVAPHHGSRTSSSQDFIDAVNPGYVVVPVGYRNRFGHPHALVSARYRQAGARVLRTDESGAITIRFGASGISIDSQRAHAPRYWHDR